MRQPVPALHLVEPRHGAFELERPHAFGIEGLGPGGGQHDQLGPGLVERVHQAISPNQMPNGSTAVACIGSM